MWSSSGATVPQGKEAVVRSSSEPLLGGPLQAPLGEADPDGVESVLEAAHAATDPAQRARLEREAVLRTLPLADSVARRYYGRGIDLDDLVQVARMALVKAVRRYRPGAGAGFTVFAVPTISGEIKRYFRDSGWAVRPPRRLQELRVALVEQEERLLHELHREPSVRDLAQTMGLARGVVSEARLTSAAYRALSLDAPAPGGTAQIELTSPGADPYEVLETHDALRRALAQLTERERQIVHLRFVEECTQAQIGAALGVSQMQVSRLLVGILRTLRVELTEEGGQQDAAPSAADVSA